MTVQEIFRLKRTVFNCYSVYYEDSAETVPIDFTNSQVLSFNESIAVLSDGSLVDLNAAVAENFVVVLPINNPELDWLD